MSISLCVHLPGCLSVCLCNSLVIRLSLYSLSYMLVCLHICLSVYIPCYLSVCIYSWLSVYPSESPSYRYVFCMFVCVHIFLVISLSLYISEVISLFVSVYLPCLYLPGYKSVCLFYTLPCYLHVYLYLCLSVTPWLIHYLSA